MNQVADDARSVAAESTAQSSASTSLPSSASAVRLVSAYTGPIIEALDEESDGFELRDLTMYEDSFGNINMVSQVDLDISGTDSDAYTERCMHFDMSYSDTDDSWSVVDSEGFDLLPNDSFYTDTECIADSIRAIGSLDDSASVEVVLDSGADGSVLPLEYANIGSHDTDFKSSSFIDAQGNPIDVRGARIAEVRFGSVVFRERFIIAAVTSPLISMGRLLKDGWGLHTEAGNMTLVRNGRSFPVHFRRNSICAYGNIRMVNAEATEQSHVRALRLGSQLENLGRGWTQVAENVIALHSNSQQHVDTLYCPSDGLLWLRTTLIRHEDGTWELEEFSESIAELESRVAPLISDKAVTDTITIAHTEMVPPEALGFSIEDDVEVAERPNEGSSSSSSSRPFRATSLLPFRAFRPDPVRPDPVPAAPDEQEQAVVDRDVGDDCREVLIDGVKLDSNSSLATLRGACDSLGLSRGGGKMKCLKRLWDHLQTQEMIAAHDAQRHLQGDIMRPAVGQPVPAEPSQAQKDEHCLTHYPYAAWCELCVANRGRQDKHVVDEHRERSSHSCVSFDFGYASRNAQEDQLTALFIHDKFTGAMHAIPTPQKGGKYLNFLCTEMCRFVLWLGHETIGLKCDNEPAIRALRSAVAKTLRCLGVKVVIEATPPESHQSNGGAEVTVQVIRSQANLLVQQIERGCGIAEGTMTCHHPLYEWALLHSAWLHNRYVVKQGHTAYELCANRVYSGRVALFGECVLGYLKQTKGAPQWVKGIWLGKTISNDVNIIAVPGSLQLFVTGSIRRFPGTWNGEMIGQVEASPWQFNYASLGSQLVYAKRISPPTPAPFTPALRDYDAEAVRDIPPSPVEEPVHRPRVAPPPPSSVPVLAGELGDAAMTDAAEAGSIPAAVGLAAPVTPVEATGSGSALEAPMALTPSQAVHARDDGPEDFDSRPSKHQRIMNILGLDNEDDIHPLCFEEAEIEDMEAYDMEFQDEVDFPVDDVTTADVLKQLCYPYSQSEPQLSEEELMRIDTIADQLEISRLKDMGVLIPSNGYDFGGQTPKRLTTKMVRTWRDKHIDGQRVWLRRSRYVAREFAWLSPERQDLFSPASSVLTVRLLPTLFMKWKTAGYVLCSIDVGDAFLMVPQRELTQVTCIDAAGSSSEFVLGRVLPGQRNGSQMWHEAFSGFLKNELNITECSPYPCLLRSGGGECVLLLHVDDVMCLARESYLHEVLVPALKAKYKISLEVVKEEGDELTFLKRKHVLISKDQLAIQSHPKHLEKLFEHLKLNKKLAPKKTPGHALLDEPDRSEELNGVDSKTFRSCVGILLYIASDYLECQYTIRALSQFMSRPTKHAMMCLRHLAQYLLGCVDHCIILTYKGHHGLLHYTPEDYTLEVYSDSDWAKHRESRKSVSSGFLCLFGNVLYSSSRSQKALALSSAEAEIYAATGACCDGVLLYHCLCFVLGGDVTVKFTVNMDNSAGRAFLLRSGVGRIRHISVRVLWMQQKVKEQMIQPAKVGTRDNISDLGTKRLSRERMLYLMCLCKVYNLESCEFVGSSVFDKVIEQDVMKQGIKMFKEQGFNTRECKQVLRVLLISALSQHSMAMENETALFTGDGSTTVLHVLIYVLFTLLLLCFGCIWYLLTKVNYLYSGKKDLEIRVKLFKVMDLLKNRLLKSAGIKFGEDAEEEGKTDDESVGETQSEKQTRYHNSELCEVSDPEYWQLLHHGAPTESEDEQMEASLLQSMRDANAALETRIQRLQCEWDEAEAMNQLEAMEAIDRQINEARMLRYNI